ncbi:hypothetical protein L2449_27255 [Mesorhizobium muleiense]|uniref:hypothetical protein n=1 Tax=Mesorhizobium muleiense TaxID=1004279 RepID=UPI001F380721|nr:hypothetical protein [Mesorhizobium muleiense]MCF6120526.1 hypothetical protein [Mesorhizobium muleiense]
MGRKRGSKNAKAPIADQATKAPVVEQSGTGPDAAVLPVQEPAGGISETAQGNQPVGNAAAGAADSAKGSATGAEGAGGESLVPLYKCHKQVRALKLTDIELNNDTGQVRLTPEDKRYAPFDAPPNWYARYGGSDADTGYFVQYEDGFASWSPTKAFEDGYSLMPATAGNGDEGESDLNDTATVLSVAELARAVAGGALVFANGGMAVDFEHVFDSEEAAIMADFVRDNPDAPVTAMLIHLGLKKRQPRTEPNTADMMVLSLFHSACVAAFKFEADRAAEEAAAKAKPEPSGGWPGERALQPQKPALSPSGFTPR